MAKVPLLEWILFLSATAAGGCGFALVVMLAVGKWHNTKTRDDDMRH
jgi:hypothetical protein